MLDNSRFTVDRWNDLRFVPQTDVGKAGDLKARGRRLYITNAGVVEDLTAAKCFMVIIHRFKGKLSDLEMRRVPPYNYVFEMEYPENVLYYGELEIQYRLVTPNSTYYSLTGKINVQDNFFEPDKVTSTSEFRVLDSSLQKLVLLNSTVDKIESIDALLIQTAMRIAGTPNKILEYNSGGVLAATQYDSNKLARLDKISALYSDGYLIETKGGNLVQSSLTVEKMNTLLTEFENLKSKVATLETKVNSGTGGGTTPGTGGTFRVGDRVKLNSTQPGYYDADDAAAGINQASTLSAGEYYIYNIISTGQVNITKTAGVPGSWIRSSSVLTKL